MVHWIYDKHQKIKSVLAIVETGFPKRRYVLLSADPEIDRCKGQGCFLIPYSAQTRHHGRRGSEERYVIDTLLPHEMDC